jgi:hypothetical protein
LHQKNLKSNFSHPRAPEDVARALTTDVKERIREYLVMAENFLNSEIHIHYTYAFLRGVESYLSEGKTLEKKDWVGLFKLFNKLKDTDPFESQGGDRWMAKWNWLEKEMADILRLFLSNAYKNIFPDFRTDTLALIKHLLKSEDPTPEQEKNEGLGLFTVAINSVRGRAFQCFAAFVFLEGKTLNPEALKLYKEIIEQATPSVRFLIGHYLATFYFRSKDEVKALFGAIFPMDKKQVQNFLAAWGGYLANSVYKDLADELKSYYQYFLEIEPMQHQVKKGEDSIDEKMAEHLALLFFHFEDFKFNENEKHPLLETFFRGQKIEMQKHFISFLGRRFITNANQLRGRKKAEHLKKLENLWEVLLGEGLSPEVYSAFGFWINTENDVLEKDWLVNKVMQTLQKSKGAIDWDYGLLKNLGDFTEVDAEKTIIILEEYLLNGILGEGGRRRYFRIDEQKLEIFKKLYKKNPSRTKELINKLLEKGGRDFWGLMDIVK